MILQEEQIRLIFGLKLRQMRTDKGLTPAELAEKSGLSISYLNEIERGSKYPKAEKIASLANALGESYDNLVSLKLDNRLEPLSMLFKSNIIQELPFAFFGIKPDKIFDVMASAPTKVNAFINTVIELTRQNQLTKEQFFHLAVRSYQELNLNYFPEIETAATEFALKHKLNVNRAPSSLQLEEILITIYQYEIDTEMLSGSEDLKSFKSFFVDGKQPKLLINKHLSETQRCFVLARELGFQFLGIKDRSQTSSWHQAHTFDQVLNNFHASYFAGALLVNQEVLRQKLDLVFQASAWHPSLLTDLVHEFGVSAETLVIRFTNILPKLFGITNLFFLRVKDKYEEGVSITKEMHMSRQHRPHNTNAQEHYCRRWLSVKVLKELKENPLKTIAAGAQHSFYLDSEDEYLVLSIGYRSEPNKEDYGCVTLGLAAENALKKKVKFFNTAGLLKQSVNVVCERCAAVDCNDRVALPIVYNAQREKEIHLKALKELELKVRGM